jgi:hypothetical protein
MYASFLRSVIDGDEWPVSRLGPYTTGKRDPVFIVLGGCVGPGSGLGAV